MEAKMSTYESKIARLQASATQMIRENAGNFLKSDGLSVGGTDLTVERRVILNASAQSLRKSGYNLVVADGESVSAIEASKGHEKLLVLIENGGRITSDHMGVADDNCEAIQRRFEEGMREFGVSTLGAPLRKHRHHDPRGGELIAEAGRQREKNLAAGIVKSRERSLIASVRRNMHESANTKRKGKVNAHE
jgi:guanyl-specific ribonuclease Sa